jgi:hypothetical protein
MSLRLLGAPAESQRRFLTKVSMVMLEELHDWQKEQG